MLNFDWTDELMLHFKAALMSRLSDAYGYVHTAGPNAQSRFFVKIQDF